MGAGASLHEQKELQGDTNTDSSASSLTSGYNSNVSTSEQPAKPKTMLTKKGLQHRPSSIINYLVVQEEQQELALEDKHVKASPALKNVLGGFIDCKNALTDSSKRSEGEFEMLDKMLHDKIVQPFNKYSEDEQRMIMANKVARIGFVKAITDYYEFVMEELDIVAVTSAFVEEAKEVHDPGFKLVLTVREVLWNFSDGSPKFSEELTHTNIITRLVEDLEKIFEDGLEELEVDDDIFAFSSAVGILHNCARNPNVDKDVFRDAKVAENLYPFLQSNLVYVKMITLLALGNVIKENQVGDLKAGLDVFDFLIQAIKEALESPEKKKHGFHLAELVDGLASLAQSDQNKKMIMMKQPLDMIQKILKSKVHTEVLAAIRLVWELAFLEENKKLILKNHQLKQTMIDLKDHKDLDVKATARRAWFVIEDMNERIHDETAAPQQPTNKPSGGLPQGKPPGKHIMFSYCWGDKELVLKIYHVLKGKGFPIWIDINEMDKYGNVLEGMARAVEEASVILICYSEKYKNSQNCRTEADYAYCRQKSIIPVKLQRGYSPDGWLGALIGARLFIEFSPKYDFNVKMDELLKQLPRMDPIQEEPTTPLSPEPVSDPQPLSKRLSEWGKADMDNWLKQNKFMSLPKVKQLTGQQLDFLVQVMGRAPETFYRWAEDKLNLKSLEDLMRFDKALRELPRQM